MVRACLACRDDAILPGMAVRWCMRCAVLTLALFFALSAQASAAKWAVVIGVGDYADQGVPDLSYAKSDAQAVYAALTTQCGISSENTSLLVNDQATKKGIEEAFAALSRSTRQGDSVVVYFTGHGSFVRDADGDEADGDGLDETLLPYDAIPGREETQIIDDLFGYMIARLGAGSVLILLDTCHSGGQGKGVNTMSLGVKGSGDNLAKDVFTAPEARPGRVLFAACRSGQVAYESKRLRHGVFTYFVLAGLMSKRADVDGDRQVDSDELAAYVRDGMDRWEQEEGSIQTPEYDNFSATKMILVPAGIPPLSDATLDRGIVPHPTGAAHSAPVGIALLRATSSFLVPGLGQIMNHEFGKGVLYFGIAAGILGVAGLAANIFEVYEVTIGLTVTYFCWETYCAYDAYTVARRGPVALELVPNGVGFALSF